MKRFLKRNITSVIKLPFAMGWDIISLGNMGETSSTEKVIKAHKSRAQADEILDMFEELAKLKRGE